MASRSNDLEGIAIRVSDVSKTFKLPHERTSSLKGLLVNFFRRTKTFEKQKALQDISFDIHKGDFFAIVGRNGSGKSTLLKMLAGIYIPDAGTIYVDGKLTPFIELGVGFNPELTGRENVFLNGALLGFNHRDMDAMYDDIVEFAELERFMDQKLKNYSSGMQVRLAFSIAIRAKGDILLLDEVLAVGDTAFQQKCYNYFEELKAQQRTVVFVSHDMGAVRRFCNRAVYVSAGTLIAEGTPSKIAERYEIDNLESVQKAEAADAGPKVSNLRSVRTKIVEQTADRVVIKVLYTSKDDLSMYAGISVIRDGFSVGEINTLPQVLVGDGYIHYSLDITPFNPGMYEITVALFAQKNRELVSLGRNKSRFIIKGRDDTRGASVKLADTWSHEV